MNATRREWAITIALWALLLAAIFTRIHGWGDWSIGGNTSYCGIYWPHLDAYCQSGH